MPNKKQMYNRNAIMTGIVIFFIIASLPFWYNHFKVVPVPEPLVDKAKFGDECIMSKEYMTAEHMQLLEIWRDNVVRKGERIFVNDKGKEFNMSLSNTCLDCHISKSEFCDKCHAYASVDPYCWDCHIDKPKEASDEEE